jgi:D-alanine transaminase
MQVYLNGEYMPLGQACVPVLDRGFLFGDGVYEVIPVYGGHPFRLQQHLDRLESSLKAIRIPSPHSVEEWKQIFQGLIDTTPGQDSGLYLQVTRGVAPRDHSFPEFVRPTVFAMLNPIKPVSPEILHTGIKAVVREDIRWDRCDIKSVSLLGNVLLKQEAIEAGAAETIMVRDGRVTEGSISNIFVVKTGEIITPARDQFLLGGITRDLVLELARRHGLPVREAEIREPFLRAADEIWTTSSTREVLPVTQLDGNPVGDGRPGPVWETIRTLYGQCKERLRQGHDSCG